MTDTLTLSYQTRLMLDQKRAEILLECACLFNDVEHFLYGAMATGKTSASCKNHFLKKYRITARQFNACRVSLEGKIAANRTSQERAIDNLKQQITILDQSIRLLEKKSSKQLIMHQKKRRRNCLLARLSSKEKDLKEKRTHLCFGGKKLSCSISA